MWKEVFLEIFSEFYNSEYVELYSRKNTIELIPGRATILTGVRRCGKSVLANQLSEKFGFKKKQILAINFSDFYSSL